MTKSVGLAIVGRGIVMDSEIIAGEGLGGGAGVGITWYKQLSEGWVYGEAPINWHNPRLSYPFGSGSLIANSNNFCKSNV